MKLRRSIASRVFRIALTRGSAVLFGVFLALLVSEAALRWFAPQDLSGRWLTSSKRGYPLNRAFVRARHQFGERVVSYRINALHQRGDEPHLPAGRILLLGDSFTFGWLVSRENTFAAHLQTALDLEFGREACQISNAGTGSWGTSDALAYLEEFGDQAAPDLVVAFLNVDDIERIVRRGMYRLEEATHSLDVAWIEQPNSLRDVTNAVPGYAWLLEHSHLLQVVRQRVVRLLYYREQSGLIDPKNGVPSSATRGILGFARELELAKALFLRMAAWCRERAVPFIVYTTGAPVLNASGPTAAFLQQAPDFFEEHGISYFDLRPVVSGPGGVRWEQLIIPGDGHPNESGHRTIAAAVWPSLRAFVTERMLCSSSSSSEEQPIR